MEKRELNFASNPAFTKAEEFMKQKMPHKAVGEYLQSMFSEKKNIQSYIGISRAYRELHQYSKAIKQLEKAKSISNFEYEIYYELGLNYIMCEDFSSAAKNFRHAIKLNPDLHDPQIQLAISHELMDEPEMAFQIYEKIIEENDENIVAHNHKAGLLMSLGQFEEAAKIFFKILSVDEDCSRGYLGLGICFDKMEKYSNAVRFYKKYIAKNPENEVTKSIASRIIDIVTALSGVRKNCNLRIAK